MVLTKNFELGRSKKFERDMTLHTNTVSTANFLSGADAEFKLRGVLISLLPPAPSSFLSPSSSLTLFTTLSLHSMESSGAGGLEHPSTHTGSTPAFIPALLCILKIGILIYIDFE